MIAQRSHSKPDKSKRPSVDIYFVLYLTALVLLLGTTPITTDNEREDLEEAVVRLMDLDFFIDVEKIGLYIPIRHASDASLGEELRNDTINEVSAHGSFESVSFRIIDVTDTITGTRPPSSPGMLIRTSDSTARFIWNSVPTESPAVYYVEIEGIAEPRIPNSVQDPKLRDKIAGIMKDRAELRDTARFLVNVVSLDEVLLALQAPTAPTVGGETRNDSAGSLREFLALLGQRFGNSSSFTARASRPFVYPSSQGTWTQSIMVLGSDPSDVRILSPGNVRITGRDENELTISGSGPINETSVVNLVMANGQNETIGIEFEVRAVRSKPTPPPSEFIVDNIYAIDLSIPEISDARVSVEVIENSALVQQGRRPDFEYRPSGPGNGAFVLYVEGNEYDRFPFEVVNVPAPSGSVLRNTRDSVIIEVITYGRINGLRNIGVVKIRKGQNVREPELRTQRFDTRTLRWTQTWVIERTEMNGDPFDVSIYDQRGMGLSKNITIPAP